MNQDWSILIKLSACFLLLFVIAEFLFNLLHASAESKRRIAHIGAGILSLTFPFLFDHIWQVLIICLSALLLLIICIRYKLFKSISAIASTSVGSFLYPLIVIVTFVYYQLQIKNDTIFDKQLYFYLPILIMAVCDPLASLSGSLYKRYTKNTDGKTWIGSLIFFITAFILSLTLFQSYNIGLGIMALTCFALIASIITTIVERYSSGGWDNVTIPLSIIAWLTIIDLFL